MSNPCTIDPFGHPSLPFIFKSLLVFLARPGSLLGRAYGEYASLKPLVGRCNDWGESFRFLGFFRLPQNTLEIFAALSVTNFMEEAYYPCTRYHECVPGLFVHQCNSFRDGARKGSPLQHSIRSEILCTGLYLQLQTRWPSTSRPVKIESGGSMTHGLTSRIPESCGFYCDILGIKRRKKIPLSSLSSPPCLLSVDRDSGLPCKSFIGVCCGYK